LGLAFHSGVDCWIGVVQQTDRRLVRLAGRLSVEQVPELLEACAEARPIELDLAELVSADAAGIEALQRLRRQGATLVSAPGYLQLKLDSHAERPLSVAPPKGGRLKD
jgi:ABC-type transporter Mla MlaB component